MKSLPFSKDQLEAIAAQFPTPFYIYDEAALRARVAALQKAFSWNGGYREYYAVKACPNPILLSIMRDMGCGLDCSSYTELMIADAIGVRGERIMFSSNDTPKPDMCLARELGATINLDDINDIDFLAENGGIPEMISCRFNPGGDFRAENDIIGCPRESKYGFTRAQLTEGFKKLIGLGVKRFGIHSFLASCTIENGYYPALARLLFTTARELHEETGADIAFVNLSGGIGIPYRPEDIEPDIAVIGEGVRAAYEETFAGTGMAPAVFTELGRYVTGPVGFLVTRAIHHKDTYKHYVGVDACAANLMRPAVYGAYHEITVMGKEHAPRDHVYDVTGGLCENSDKFAVDRPLPRILDGDLLVIHDAGAHGFSMGYNYNGRLRSAEVLLKCDGSAQLIRRAETPEDYFSTLRGFGM